MGTLGRLTFDWELCRALCACPRVPIRRRLFEKGLKINDSLN